MSVNWNKILLFGDSITQRSFDQSRGFSYAAALQNAYVRKLDVINRGFSGYNSEWARKLFPYVINAEHRPGISEVKLATIFLGTNDASTTFQEVKLQRYLENMRYMINCVKEKHIPLIVIGPGFHDIQLNLVAMGLEQPFSSNKALKGYSDGLKSVCSELQVPFIELRKELLPLTGYTEEQLNNEDFGTIEHVVHDGIHYTADTYKVMFEKVTETIKEKYPELVPEELPFMFPEYRELNTDAVEKALFGKVMINE